MKTLYLVIALLIAIPLSLVSKVGINAGNQPHKQNLPSVTKDYLLNFENNSKDKNFRPTTLGSLKVLDTTVDVIFNSYYGDNTPMAFEPISGTLFMVQTDRYNTVVGTDTVLLGVVYLYYSQDNGASWSRETIFEKAKSVPVNPTISVTNPRKSTNPNDLFVAVFNRYFKYNDFTKNYETIGGLYLFNSGKGLAAKYEEFEEAGPSTNNTGYQWSLSKALSYTGSESSLSYFYGRLDPNTGVQYGMYGIGNLEFDKDGLLGNYSTMPTNWGPLVWRPSTSVDASYNAPLYVDVDVNGTLYAAVNNIFADNIDKRVLAISKSTDNGATWTDFDRVPQSVFDAYNTKEGLESSLEPQPYLTSGFAVTGVDEYSYIMTFQKVVSTTAELFENKIVELYKKGGEWKMRDIASNTGDTYRPPYLIQDTNTAAEVVDAYDDNARGYEIQLAKTADGQSLLLKYIDNRDSLVTLNEMLTLAGGGQVEVSLTTDIWVAYRDVADQKGWSTPVTVTDDIWMNKVTWIPSVIPSLTQVPIIEHVTLPFTNPTNPRVINKYPRFVENFVVGSYIRNWVLFASFDATKGENIKNPAVQRPVGADGETSVEELINSEINSFNIYPNPVSSNASITYDIVKNANVKIEIYSTMGELVKTVRNYSLATPGITAIEFDATDLSSGVYYVTMTANGKKVTKLMNVVR